MTDVTRLLRDAAALHAAVARYELASEAHARRETQLLLAGRDRIADLHHRADRIALRALIAEQDDPTPEGLTA